MRIYLIALSVTSSVVLAGCSHTETVGDKMIHQSEETIAIGKKWNKGEQEIKEGKELLIKGKDLKEQSELKIHTGEEKVLKGKDFKAESEKTFKKQFPTSNINKK